MSLQQKELRGKLVYRINSVGDKVPVFEGDDLGDIVVEETPGSITLTNRGTLLIMNQELRGLWEKQQTIAKKYKRKSNKTRSRTITPIYDAIDPTVRITENGSLNYMNPDENHVMDSQLTCYAQSIRIGRAFE